MHRFLTCCVLFLALAVAAGCGPGPEEVAEQENEAQWAAIETTRQQLTDRRGALEQAQAAAVAAAAEEGAAEPAADETATAEAEGAAAPAEDVAALEAEVAALTEQFNAQLVDFINANPPVVGETPPERVQQAIRMKSDEDILIAQEYIAEGGDYLRALQIYDAALDVDPDYERLQQLRAEAEQRRFMTEERFAQVEDGMTQDQVRELLGPVNLRNIRDYEENQAVAWFYPRDNRGSAAAVWFKKNREGESVVYQIDFHFKDAGEGTADED
jgi:hypothetical protein